MEKGIYPPEESYRFEKDTVQLVSESDKVDEYGEEALPPSHPVQKPLPPIKPVAPPTPPITKCKMFHLLRV